MKIFQCSNCGNPVYFSNTKCVKCKSALGFLDSNFQVYYSSDGVKFYDGEYSYRYCLNNQHDACNWLIPEYSSGSLCKACNLNRTIPFLKDEINFRKWRKIEESKHLLVYGLLRFNLPLISKAQDGENGMCFDFLVPNKSNPKAKKVRTGHSSGVITINVEEADSVHREFMRTSMHERYRTLIGHFRHEVGHYYWDQLIYKKQNSLAAFRAIFGDERKNYAESLKDHYKIGPPQDWQHNFISKYASSHPWEDWAETWSHYLHVVSTLETAYSFGLSLNPVLNNSDTMRLEADFNPYYTNDFDKILQASAPLTFAVNSINRSMGLPDLYPFVFNPAVIEKLRFVHNCINLNKATSQPL